MTSEAASLRSAAASFNTALSKGGGEGFVVIETNYRVYAYTGSFNLLIPAHTPLAHVIPPPSRQVCVYHNVNLCDGS